MATLPKNATYRVTVNWATGTDADTEAFNEVSYLTRPGIVVSGIGRATHRAYAPPGTPACDFTLPNTDGRYSPGGILGGFVGRGPETTFDAVWGADILGNDPTVTGDDPDVLGNGRQIVRLFSGNIDTAPQRIDKPATVQIRSLGKIALLNDQSPVIPVHEDIRTDEAITLILDAIGWDADARVIDTGDTDLLYFWADGSQSALSLITMLLGSEGVPACAYEDQQGRFHFEGRQYRQNATRSNTVQWNLFDGPVGTYAATGNDPTVLGNDPNVFGNGPLSALLYHIVPAQWQSNPDEVVATVRASVNVRTPTSTQKVWEYGGPLVLSNDETRDIEATASDPFKSAVTPQSGTDYTVAAGSLSSVTLLETSGTKVRIRLVAGSGGATVNGVTSNGIQLRAVSLPVTTTVPVTSTVDTDVTAARFRPRDHTINLWPEIAANQALDLVNAFARRYQRPRDQMTVQLVNLDADHMYAMLNMAISDRVHIRHRRAGINSDFFIESMSHALTDGGGLHRLTLNCERVTADVPAQYGKARYGFDQYTE
jgi:hypothetical protein